MSIIRTAAQAVAVATASILAGSALSAAAVVGVGTHIAAQAEVEAAEAALIARVENAVSSAADDAVFNAAADTRAREHLAAVYKARAEAERKAAEEKARKEEAEEAARQAAEQQTQETATSTPAATAEQTSTAPAPAYTVQSASGTLYATTALNVRSGPGTGYSKVGSLAYGQAVTVSGEANGWYQIGDGRWASGSYLTATKPATQTQTQKTTSSTSSSSASSARSVAESTAAQWGLTISYVQTTTCGSSVSPDYLWGCFWSTAPTTIELTANIDDFDSYSIRTLVTHEAAHAVINRTCGTTRPAIAGSRYENVTDAYAHLFMGGASNGGGYGYNSSDAEIARQIHTGVCS